MSKPFYAFRAILDEGVLILALKSVTLVIVHISGGNLFHNQQQQKHNHCVIYTLSLGLLKSAHQWTAVFCRACEQKLNNFKN